MCTTLPFGAAASDFDLLDRLPQPNRCFVAGAGLNGACVGRAGDDMRPALTVLFEGLRQARERHDELNQVRLHFVGTSYASADRARKTVEPVAHSDLAAIVSERTDRIPYFEGLQLLKDADFLVLIGSDDPAYTASKAYPYLMSGKPILAVLHERSSLVRIIRSSGVATVITFRGPDDQDATHALEKAWPLFVSSLGNQLAPNRDLLARFSAREMTRIQCGAFDRVVATREQAAA
jgi:hypothetical protein